MKYVITVYYTTKSTFTIEAEKQYNAIKEAEEEEPDAEELLHNAVLLEDKTIVEEIL